MPAGGLHTGSATLDFLGSNQPAKDVATAQVTGQSGILTTSLCRAYLMGDSTADNDGEAHEIAARLLTLVCGTPTPGQGFAIYGIGDQDCTGIFTVRWMWD
jgi:hypothetical protein